MLTLICDPLPLLFSGIEGIDMNTITSNTPGKVTAPRGARPAALWFGALLRAFGKAGDRRIQRREESDRQADAARVRRYAQSVSASDSRFAADLFAAADRHERG